MVPFAQQAAVLRAATAAPTRDPIAMSAAAVSRQWKEIDSASGTPSWRVFTIEDDSKAAEETMEKTEDGPVVSIKDLRSGASKSIPVKPEEKGLAIIARVCKLYSVKEDDIVLLFKGAPLRPTEPVAKVLAAGGVLGLVHNDRIELFWSPEHKASSVELSDDGKMFWSNHPDYCNANNQVRATKPFPVTGVFEFKIQIAGSGVGCYDSIGLITDEYDCTVENDYNKRLANDDTGWVLEMSNRNTRHANSRKRIQTLDYFPGGKVLTFTLDRSTSTFSVYPDRDGGTAELFTDLPAVPLYLAGQVCAHEGTPKYRIIDESSPPLTDWGEAEDSDY